MGNEPSERTEKEIGKINRVLLRRYDLGRIERSQFGVFNLSGFLLLLFFGSCTVVSFEVKCFTFSQ